MTTPPPTEGALTLAFDASKEARAALDGLPARTREQGEHAFDAAVLDAAARLEEDAPGPWFALKREMAAALKESGSSLREWERAIAVQKRARKEEARQDRPTAVFDDELVVDPDEPHAREGFGFAMTPGAILRDSRVPEPIAGFSAVITRERVVYDGAEEQREYEVSARVGESARTLWVPAREFVGMAWVGPQLGARAWIAAGRGCAEEVRVAIQRLSGEIPFEEAFAMVGWHRHREGAWRYHHAGGAVGTEGVVAGCSSAPLPRFAAGFDLPPPPEGAARGRAVRAAAACFAVHGAVSAAVFSLVWRALLGSSQASIHLAGAPGSGKSELAAIAQRHFGATMDRRRLPMSWRMASDNVLARARNTIGDSVLVIDDLVVRGARDEEKVAERVDAVFRGGWNGQGMERLTREGAVRTARPPRSTVLSTGEVVPQGYSLRQRVFVVDVERSPTDYAECMAAAQGGLLASAVSAAVRWLAPSMDAIRAGLDRRDAEEARRFRRAGDRPSQVAGALLVGAKMFFRFAQETEALTAREALAALARVTESLGMLALAQAGHQSEEDPALRFRALVLDAIASGRAHLTAMDGVGSPAMPGAWGWKLGRDVPVAERDDEGAPTGPSRAETWCAQGDRIGQRHPEHPAVLLLDPGPALDAARAAATRRGNPLPFSSVRELAHRLERAGLLAATDPARQTHTRRARVGGRAVDRLWLKLEEEPPDE